MPTKVDTIAGRDARVQGACIALLGFSLALFAFLCVAPTHALALEPVPGVTVLEQEDDGTYEELEVAGECEVRELEAEENGVPFEECDYEEDEGEEEEEEEEEEGSQPPPECLLRTANARVFTHASRNRVSLIIGYTSFAPAKVKVDYRLKGGKGSLNLGQATHRFSKQGVFRITGKKLTDSQMEKVKAAKDFAVRIRIPEAPGYCRSYYTQHLDAKRKVHGQVVWFESKSPKRG